MQLPAACCEDPTTTTTTIWQETNRLILLSWGPITFLVERTDNLCFHCVGNTPLLSILRIDRLSDTHNVSLQFFRNIFGFSLGPVAFLIFSDDKKIWHFFSSTKHWFVQAFRPAKSNQLLVTQENTNKETVGKIRLLEVSRCWLLTPVGDSGMACGSLTILIYLKASEKFLPANVFSAYSSWPNWSLSMSVEALKSTFDSKLTNKVSPMELDVLLAL